MAISGKLEITLKINALPNAQSTQNGWQSFDLDCDGQIVSVVVKPKVWKKLTDAQANWPQWVAAMVASRTAAGIAGKMGQRTEQGFVLEEPSIQVFERKPKEPKVEAEPVAATAS